MGGGYYVDLTGQTVRVPEAEEATAVDQGYIPASPEQVKNLTLGEKFGSPGQQAISGLEGGADALTLGLSSQLETKVLGVPAENIRGREGANPLAHGIGTGLGILGPLIFSGGAAALPEAAGEAGTSALRTAAEASAPSLVSKAGEAAASGVKAILPEATTAGGRVATKLATGVVRGGVEGGLFGLGNVIHEDALGDPGLTASSAMEEIGLSALLGGGLGGASGILGGLTAEVPSSKLGQKLADWLPEFEGERNLKAAGAIQSDMSRAAKQMSREELNKIGREAGDLGLVGPFSTPAKTADRAANLMEEAGGRMGDILNEADAAGAKPIGSERLMKRGIDEIVKPLEANPLEKATAAKMREVLDGYRELHAAEGPSFRDLHAMRKQLSDKIYGLKGMMDPDANALKSALHDFRTIVSDELDKGLEKAGLDTQAWKVANREYRVAATIQKFAQKGMDRAAGNHLLSLSGLLSGLTGFAAHGGPLGVGMALGAEGVKRFGSGILSAGAKGMREWLEKGAAEEAAGKSAELISAERQGGADHMAQEAARAPESVAALSQLEKANQAVASRVDKLVSGILTGSGKSVRTAMAKGVADLSTGERLEKVARLAQNPEAMQQHLLAQTSDLNDHAPKTAQALQVGVPMAVGFLHSKAPKMPKPTPLGPKYKLDKAQEWKWNRYFHAVSNPTHILKHAAAGTLTPMDVEAVKTVHPALYAHMQQSVLEHLSNRKEPLPYRQRLMLSMLMGSDLDGTMSPESVMANQATFAMPSQKSGQDVAAPRAPKSTQTGLGKLKTAERARTPSQAIDARMEA